MKKYFYTYIVAVIGLMSYAGCDRFEENVFSESPSQRIDAAVEECKSLLMSSSTGWIGAYYPEASHKIGGYNMHFKFSSDKDVTISCDTQTDVAAGVESTSHWSMNKSQGPIVSFDTYNSVLHYFSKVTGSSDVDGLAGDYEFVVDSISADKKSITLVGKKRKNILQLNVCPSELNVEDFFKAAAQTEKYVSAYGMFELLVDGKSYGTGALTKHAIDFQLPSTVTTASNFTFAYTDGGIQLYQPITVDGVTMNNFKWDLTEEKFICTDNGVNAVMVPKYPDDYQLKFAEYFGEWTFEYETEGRGKPSNPAKRKTTTVTITGKSQNETLNLSAPDLWDFENMELTFIPTKGQIAIYNQYIPDFTVIYNEQTCSAASDESKQQYIGTTCWLRFCVINATSTSTGTGTPPGSKQGLQSVLEKKADGHHVITFETTGVWSTPPIGFAIRMYKNGTTTSYSSDYTGNKAGAFFTYFKLTKK